MCLADGGFAEQIFNILESFPTRESLKIGIYSSWGEGKTSVLKFIDHLASEKEYKIFWFNPIPYSNPNSLFNEFCYQLADLLGISNRLKRFIAKNFPLIKSVAGLLKKEISDVAELIPIQRLLAISKDEISNYLAKNKKKLIIFIDDLDRAEEKLLPQILLNLKTILDIPNCYFIIAIDPNVVAEGLLHSNPQWKDKNKYEVLEKVIDVFFYLPEISEDNFNKLIDQQVLNSGNKLDPATIQAVRDYLPRNPRKLKQFIRQIVCLHDKLSRFDQYELNKEKLYLSQLLRLEFPEQVKGMLKNSKVIDHIGIGMLADRLETDASRRFNIIELLSPSLPKQEQSRFSFLYNAIVKSTSLKSYGEDENVLLLFNIIDVSIVLTWKEFEVFFTKYKTMLDNEATKHIAAINDPALLNSYILKTIRARHNMLGSIADINTQEDMKKELEDVGKASDMLKKFLANTHYDVTLEVFREMMKQQNHWIKFTNPDFYIKHRNDEKEIVNMLLDKVLAGRLDMIRELAESLRIKTISSFEHSAEMRSYLEDIYKKLENKLLLNLIELFSQKDGIHSLWGQDKFIIEKTLMFDPESAFHKDEYRKIILAIINKASDHPAIQENCLEYIRMLEYGITNIFPVDQDKLQALAKDKDFIGAIWKSATVKELNRRVVGSLERDRATLIKIADDSTYLPIPKWWELMLEAENKIQILQ